MYGGIVHVELKRLTIGGVESACLTDLIAAYISNNPKEVFILLSTLCISSCRDDRLRNTKEKNLQIISAIGLIYSKSGNKLCRSNHLKFTVVI